ncbi:alpha/beta fold hydrolase [Crateriforma conspicua]|uniref:Alpha/beta hydrolase family protein n=1 Tax=Crateriforma conspicua TaxID=2527996 RepID=A0A5C6FXC7_9PLAN|nr:alpha/beta fold hydrolase [Crateriforma conspicua]TWU67121.1 Alpha/beta hydrolase family protein [Crateriforma conspicua]
MKVEFFGDRKTQLLGVTHRPSHTDSTSRAIVFVPPIGHEYIRTHWAMKLLAKQLARKHMHVLRFDLRGHGDSFGNPSEVRSLDAWRSDINNAIDHFKERSCCDSVALLGLRAGAGLITDVATTRDDVHSIIAWEPVLHGRRYLTELRRLHSTMLDLWFEKTQTVNDSEFEEIIAWKYQRSLVEEMDQWRPPFESLALPHLVVESHSNPNPDLTPTNSMRKTVPVAEEYSWNRLCDLETAWLRPHSTRTLVNQIQNLFERLEQKGMLTPKRELCLT